MLEITLRIYVINFQISFVKHIERLDFRAQAFMPLNTTFRITWDFVGFYKGNHNYQTKK